MRRSLLVFAAASALALADTAAAGGWATVQLSSTPPRGLSAGEPWVVDITVLQHGRTPLDGLKPTLTIRKSSSRVTSDVAKRRLTTRTFAARPAGSPGVYRVRVVFPSAGTWRYEVYDGFVQYRGARTHHYAPVKIARIAG
jgi:hypothetical protein